MFTRSSLRHAVAVSLHALLIAPAMALPPLLPDVIGQFDALSTRPDALGFHLDRFSDLKSDVDKCRHWQGLWRHQAVNGTPYLFVTRSQNRPGFGADIADLALCGFATTGGGDLAVVRLGSRDKDGERLRSNRLAPGTSTQDSTPSIHDTVVQVITFDGTNGWPAYDHPGGMQAVDGVLAIAMEAPLAGSSDPGAAVEFVDIRNPEHPARLARFVPLEPGVKAGLVGLTQRADGRYFMVLTGAANETLWFYESQPTETDGSTNLRSPVLAWRFVYEWSAAIDGQSIGATWHTGPAHQTLQFLREGSPDGALYLAAARGEYGLGDDYLDLYRVERFGDYVTLQHASSRHKSSYANSDGARLNTGGANQASFAAASTFYVSPAGELLFYATEHDNDGPFESVRAGEWRHIDMVRPDSDLYDPSALFVGPMSVPEGTSTPMSAQGRQPIARAWMQFWEGESHSGRYVVMDYNDRLRDDFDDFQELDGILDGFNDEAESWRWFAPVGCTMRANDHDLHDDDFDADHSATLTGSGAVASATRLNIIANDAGTGDMNETVTSAEFHSDCDDYYRAPIDIYWDVDRNGSHETAGYSIVFDSTQLDGPSTIDLPLLAVHSTDQRAGTSNARINITNVRPELFSLRAVDGLGLEIGVDTPFVITGLATVLEGEFFDQGRLDTHTARIVWGDGIREEQDAFDHFSDCTGGSIGRVRHTHRFQTPGVYSVEIDVFDDDFDHHPRSVQVTVVGIEQALERAVAEIDGMTTTTTNPALRRLLDKALSAIAGHGGALGKLEAEQQIAALNKLAQAADRLDDASDLIDTDLPLSMIALVAQAVAVESYEAAATPSGTATDKLARVRAALDLGAAHLTAGAYQAAISAFKSVLVHV